MLQLCSDDSPLVRWEVLDILVNRISRSLTLFPELNHGFLTSSVLPFFTLSGCKLILGLYLFSLYPDYECYFASNDDKECKTWAPRLQVCCAVCQSCVLPVTLSLLQV